MAAVFDAFLTIYKAAVADLLRIATDGTGVLPAGHLHPDLVNRLADEAAQSAGHVLNMCIRALDYCPPVDLTFGDYLRAIVTADYEFDPVDETNCRVAFVEAFRRHGIVPEGVRTVSVDGLLWRESADAPEEDENAVLSEVRKWAPDIASWSLTRGREKLYELMKRKRAALHSYLQARLKKHGCGLSGINFELPVEVHSIRPSFRSDWEGRPRFQWVIELTQRDGKFTDPEGWLDPDGGSEYWFRGGCTLVVDAETGKLRYSIRKTLDDARRERRAATCWKTATKTWPPHTLEVSAGSVASHSQCCIDCEKPHGALRMKTVRVRMYRQGLGDCFLLSFPRPGGESHVLIDCGVLKGTGDATARIRRVAESILTTTGGRLDALVVTHQHWDHVSGFLQAEDIFNRLAVGEVWLAWTEDPGDELASELAHRRRKAATAVENAVTRLSGLAEASAQRTAESLNGLLAFQGELGLSGPATTAKAIEWVKARENARLRYFTPGCDPVIIPGVDDVRVYVLGPPRHQAAPEKRPKHAVERGLRACRDERRRPGVPRSPRRLRRSGRLRRNAL